MLVVGQKRKSFTKKSSTTDCIRAALKFLFFINCEEVQVECLKIQRSIDKHFTKDKKETTIKDLFNV